MENLENVGVGDAREAAVSKHGADGFAVSSRPAFERVNDRQRGFAFSEV